MAPAPSAARRRLSRPFVRVPGANHEGAVHAVVLVAQPGPSYGRMLELERALREIGVTAISYGPDSDLDEVLAPIVNIVPLQWLAYYLSREIGVDGDSFRRDEPRYAPAQSMFTVAERAVRTFRQECLGHIILLNERHLLALLTEFVRYYSHDRPHRTLELGTPVPRPPMSRGVVVSRPS